MKQYRKKERSESDEMSKSDRSKLASANYRDNVKNDIEGIQEATFELQTRLQTIKVLAAQIEQGEHWQISNLKQVLMTPFSINLTKRKVKNEIELSEFIARSEQRIQEILLEMQKPGADMKKLRHQLNSRRTKLNNRFRKDNV